ALREALASVGRGDIMVTVGGVIPPGDFQELYDAGAAAIYPPGTVISDAAIELLGALAGELGHELASAGATSPDATSENSVSARSGEGTGAGAES
ncbi:MAG: hypothetical protein ACK4M5_17435, partial [Dietzia cercidiphylli]